MRSSPVSAAALLEGLEQGPDAVDQLGFVAGDLAQALEQPEPAPERLDQESAEIRPPATAERRVVPIEVEQVS